MISNEQKAMRAAVREYFAESMPTRIERLATLASWDLWYGPLQGCDVCGVDHIRDCTCAVRWPGFEKACDEIAAWSHKLNTLYYNSDYGEVSETAPHDDDDPWNWEHTTRLERRDVIALLWDKELMPYV